MRQARLGRRTGASHRKNPGTGRRRNLLPCRPASLVEEPGDPPVREIEILGKSRRKPPRSLTEAEREQWFELLCQDERTVQADLIDISRFMLATGERIGETLAVLWENVSLETGEVDCGHQIQRIKGKALIRLPVTTEAGERLLLLPQWAVAMLRARWKPGTPLDCPVFPDSNGGYRDPHKRPSTHRERETA